MPLPPTDYTNQFPLNKVLKKGTLFKWLYDPYEKRFF
ncbi:spore coat associated protein CotJA [Tepidibacillus marianensis]